MRYRGIIFDVDGTLVDSNDAHARAWCESLEHFGYPAPYQVIRRLVGMGGDRLIPRTTGHSKSSEMGTEVATYRGKLFRDKYLPHLKAFPKVRELYTTLEESGLALAIASSSEKRELEPLLEIAGIKDRVLRYTSSDDVDLSKPDPDVIQAALKRLDLPSKATLMIGDTPYDIEAAGIIDVRTLAFRCGGWEDENLIGALALYDGASDLLSRLVDSPLGGDGGRSIS